MNGLEYKYGVWKKSVYVDGHERSDVVEYREKFLERMGARLKRMSWWEKIWAFAQRGSVKKILNWYGFLMTSQSFIKMVIGRKDGGLKSTPTYTRRKWKVYHGFRLYLFLSWDAYVG